MRIVQAAKKKDPEILRKELARMAAGTDADHAKEDEKNFFKTNFFKKNTHEAHAARTSDLEAGSERV